MASGSMVLGLRWDLEHTVYVDHGEDHDGIQGKYQAEGIASTKTMTKEEHSLSLPLEQQDMISRGKQEARL